MSSYFYNLNKTLKKINHNYLYNLPLIFKRATTIDKDPEKKISFNFFKKDILIENKKKLKKSEIIIISHYIGQNKKSVINNDPYYGDLFNTLNKMKKKFSVIFINHTKRSLYEIYEEYKNTNYSKIFVDNQFSIKKDILILGNIMINYIYFKIILLNKKLNKKNLEFVKKNFSFFNFLKARSTLRLIGYLNKVLDINESNIKYLLTTMEGHAFEKIIFKKFYLKNVITIGYYFSVLRKKPNNIFYINDKKFCPKEIFVSGKTIQNYFKKNYHDKKIKIKIFGSNKKIKLKSFSKNSIIKKKYLCMVAAEGIYSENYILMNFVINNIDYLENIEFLFRFHPIVNKQKILNLFSEHKNIKKIRVSTNNNIIDDFKKCDFVLYRGSSVCIEAALNSVMPIYLNDEKENIDPIYEVNKFQIKNYKNLNSIVKQFKNKNNLKNNLKYLSNLQSYCKNYYSKIPNKNLFNFF
tara:strand:- start:330 stop:1727 length:1398 start_codon:yes stop_codon:yes gene_type:complete